MLNRLIRDIRRSGLVHVLAIFLASGWAVLQIIDALTDIGVLDRTELNAPLARMRSADRLQLLVADRG